MISWKVVIGSGAVAVVLSFLTGIISGVSFATILLRALLWGVIFCGIGAGISSVISKYLPELFSPPAEGGAENAQPDRAVDIVLPDENPHRSDEEEFEGYSDDDASGYRPDEAGEADDSFMRERGEMVEEVQELRRDRAQPEAREPRPPGAGAFDESGVTEELPELETDDADFPTSGTESYRSQNLSDLSRPLGASETVDVLGHRASADEIAKAIRTALKKDEKG